MISKHPFILTKNKSVQKYKKQINEDIKKLYNKKR